MHFVFVNCIYFGSLFKERSQFDEREKLTFHFNMFQDEVYRSFRRGFMIQVV
jgi:hypothetical protein